MNVFEDLITELQEENLLENTVIKSSAERTSDEIALDETVVPNAVYDAPAVDRIEIETAADHGAGVGAVPTGTVNFETAQEVPQRAPQNQRVEKNKEFFKKRAVAEVASLQMVEHVLTGVEREYMKAVPNTYDDFKAKKALNNFIHVTDSTDAEGHAEAEFDLMQETESWCSALAERDKKIPVSNLRQYCDNTKPALSSQAMLAIARFYRNLPYSESVRSKFDFVLTRLFSRAAIDEKRVCLFDRDETVKHIKTLYADWASIPLYSADDNDSNVMLAGLSFEDLALEAERAGSFDQLIKSDFFGRLRMFKESISEVFLAPSVAAAAVDANIRIGNAYVTLIARERQQMDSNSIQSKYGSSLDSQIISDATAQTLELVDLLNAPMPAFEAANEETAVPNKAMEPEASTPAAPRVEQNAPSIKTRASGDGIVTRLTDQVRSINKWVLVFCGVLILATGGLVIYSSYFAGEMPSSVGVASVDFENPAINEVILKAKVSNGTLYVSLQPTWDAMPKEKRQEVLQKIFQTGREKGFVQVNLIGKDGRSVGYASATRLDVSMP